MGGVGGPCDFSVCPSPVGLDFGTLDFGTSDSGLTVFLSSVFWFDHIQWEGRGCLTFQL